MSAGLTTAAIELRIAVAIAKDPDAGWTLSKLCQATALTRPDVSRVVQSMRFAGRLGLSNFALSPSMARRAAEEIAREGTDQDSVAARAVADSPAPGEARASATAGGVDGASAAPSPDATPAGAGEGSGLSRLQADAAPAGEPTGYHSGERGRQRREVMADAVLAMLVRAADGGLACPKNAVLCAAFGGSTSEVPAVLMRLVEAGRIRVEREGKRRRVQIVASGLWTGWSLGPERGLEEMPDHLIAAKRAEDADIEARRLATERAHAERRERALAAEAAGRVPAPVALQAAMLADRAASVSRALQDGWPETWRLLVRLSVAQSVRPLPLIDRLIRDEAAREGVRTPSLRRAPGEDDDGAVMDAADDGGPRDILDEGNWQ